MRLLLPHPIEFPLRPLGAYHRGMMLPVHRPPGGGTIAFGAAQEGMVTLLQDH